MQDEELLRCPFCDGEAYYEQTITDNSVKCTVCHTRTTCRNNRDCKPEPGNESYSWWNTRAALKSEQGGWLPIESAPKDGSPILVLANREGWPDRGYSRVAVIYYMGKWKIYGAANGEPQAGLKKFQNQTVQILDDVIPTHWQPLPQPPQSEDK